MPDCELLKSELIWVSNVMFWEAASVFHVGGVEAMKRVEVISTKRTKGERGREDEVGKKRTLYWVIDKRDCLG